MEIREVEKDWLSEYRSLPGLEDVDGLRCLSQPTYLGGTASDLQKLNTIGLVHIWMDPSRRRVNGGSRREREGSLGRNNRYQDQGSRDPLQLLVVG